MSLINQMLKDLEKRGQQDSPRDALPPSIQVVEDTPANPWLRPLYGLALVVVLVVSGWLWHIQQRVQEKHPTAREVPPIQSELGIKLRPPEPNSPVSGLPTPPPLATVTPTPPPPSNTVEIRNPVSLGEVGVKNSPPLAENIVELSHVPSPSPPLPQAGGEKPLSPVGRGVGERGVTIRASPSILQSDQPNETQAISEPPPQNIYPQVRAGSTKNQTRQGSLNRVSVLSAPADATARQLYQTGARYYSSGQFLRAIDMLERSLLLDPTQNGVRLLLAKSYAANGNLTHAADLLASIPRSASDIETEKMRVTILLKQGLYEQAETLLDQALNDYGGEPELRSFKAALDQRQGNHREAIDLYHTLIQEQPSQSKWWLGLAISLEAQERFEEARDAYQRALAVGAPSRQIQDYIESRVQALQGGSNGHD